jgi:16S rRNA (guanine527-N7)-methyltransferase
MNTSRIAELLIPFLSDPSKKEAALSSVQLEQISTYIDILLRWNARINLSAIRDSEEIVTRHFGESLFVARHLFPDASSRGSEFRAAPGEQMSAIRAADLGSGAGFPGLPIKLWASNLSMTLIESNHKKAAFLREVVRLLRLTHVNIENARAEETSGMYDIITLRAVERLEDILPVAAGLISRSGRLALLTSRRDLESIHSLLPHLAWQAAVPLPNSQSRVLAIGTRESQ